MESQQLSQYPHCSHGSTCASVTSKEVDTNQDPLDVPASKIQEFEKDSAKDDYQTTTTPVTSAIPEYHHNAPPSTTQVPPPFLTSSNNFLNWVRNCIKFLQNSNFGDIIPTTAGKVLYEKVCSPYVI